MKTALCVAALVVASFVINAVAHATMDPHAVACQEQGDAARDVVAALHERGELLATSAEQTRLDTQAACMRK
jgi:hypothetical protein